MYTTNLLCQKKFTFFKLKTMFFLGQTSLLLRELKVNIFTIRQKVNLKTKKKKEFTILKFLNSSVTITKAPGYRECNNAL